MVQPESLTPSPARFDAEKFEWLNGEHVKRLPVDVLAAQILAPVPARAGLRLNVAERALAVAELLRERAPRCARWRNWRTSAITPSRWTPRCWRNI